MSHEQNLIGAGASASASAIPNLQFASFNSTLVDTP